MGNDVFGLIYTGESSMQLRDLTYSRSVAAVPFAGRYRCIDFIMSNLVNTGISNVGIIAQKNYHSLMDHLGSGKEWELHRKRDGLFILPPFVTRDNTGIYRGTIDAYHSVMGYIRRSSQKYIIISGSHTVFNTTFHDMIAQHIRTGADITFMYNEVGIHHPDDQFNELRFNLAEDGRVTGVKATQYDGTPVTAHATKGVVIATGGYAANLQMVVDTNVYWSSDYLSTSTKTTNRSSLKGDGITMAQAVGADVTGMGYTQMMPISWIDDGNLAFGGGNYAIYINPTTGKRFVDETSERDVLSLAEFRNGIEHNGTKGVFIELANASSKIPGPYLYGNEDVEWRQYVRTVDQLAELFASLGLETDADTVRATIENYDKAVMAGEQPEGVKKTNPNALIGYAEKDENGNYLPETYKLDGVELRVRFMAPSTHHTMGGIKVDTERHALDAEDNVIPGLYAAGEVTGGIHGGNRLGGNAIVEIFVSGRTAAEAIQADNQ